MVLSPCKIPKARRLMLWLPKLGVSWFASTKGKASRDVSSYTTGLLFSGVTHCPCCQLSSRDKYVRGLCEPTATLYATRTIHRGATKCSLKYGSDDGRNPR